MVELPVGTLDLAHGHRLAATSELEGNSFGVAALVHE
jgi:hypothetical protein